MNSRLTRASLFVLAFFAVGSWPSCANAATAEDVYLQTCAVCHGPDGAGKTARGKKYKLQDLRSPEVQKLTDAQLTEIITKGKGKDMPPYEKELGKDGVAGQVAHIRTLAKKQ
jgi:mono/diheme cytochrome c family protein